VTVERTLHREPRILALYARTAASLIPGASLLPFIPGHGSELPDIDITLAGVRADPDRLSAYAEVCGFRRSEVLPVTYPHVLTFPLQMAAMADGRFPFGAVGLVHVENEIVQQRPIAADEQLDIRVRAGALEPHPRGQSFTLLCDIEAAGETVWQETSTMLHRGARGEPGPYPSAHTSDRRGLSVAADWSLGGDLGRRYAAVSGDRNPIHMHLLTARLFGFSRAIAHGMWTKARCLAELAGALPDGFRVQVRFRKPIPLPARVEFDTAVDGDQIDFVVRGREPQTCHLEGGVRPLVNGSATS
jgi:hypothetical protein